ncbi:unnamed protein product [Paramecium sonneborni]|uniref:MORN repeat protein n=1 Tax=Paramecium sonneborni TaxID=65129 RepID=A0A8S1LEG8_9CILI|nr:unnamed protein product [Paramecium sonneborni]
MGNQESQDVQLQNKEKDYQVNPYMQSKTTKNSSDTKKNEQINNDPFQDEFKFKDEINSEVKIYSFLGKPKQVIDGKKNEGKEQNTQINSQQTQNSQNQTNNNQQNNGNIEGTIQIGIAPIIYIESVQTTQISIEEYYQPWLKQKLQRIGRYEPPEKFVDETSEFIMNYQIDDKQRYQGFFKKGKRHGYGINLTQTEQFEGNFQDGVRRGWGRSLTQNTQESGYWEIDKIQRNMEINTKDVYYCGECLNSMPHGKGILKRQGISTYTGYFVQGRMEGKGFYEDLVEKVKYDGEFKCDLFHGLGTYYFVSGKKYVGQFKNSKFNGQGEMFYPNNSYYKGQFVNGLFEGQGYFYDQVQQSIYDGQWKSGKKNGKGKYTYQGIEVIGFWQNDQLQEDH